jgi:hypothetical protein
VRLLAATVLVLGGVVLLGFVLLWLAVAVGDPGTLAAVGVPIFLAAVLLAFVGLSAMLRRGDW